MKISAVLLGLALIPTAVFEIRWQHAEMVGTTIVKQVSGNAEGSLQCQRFTAALLDISNRAGEVYSREPNVAHVHYETCQDFQAWLEGDKVNPTLKQIIAVHVVAHEAEHVGGDYNEASAECKAITIDPQVAEQLGATPATAQAMQRQYITEVYPYLGSAYHGTCAVVGAIQ